MKSIHCFLLAFAFLALANAYDPSPLQDFCVAANDPNSAVFVNGKFCKDPATATVDDFTFSGLNVPGETSSQLGVNVTLLTADTVPGLNTLGVSLVRIDFSNDSGLNPPHNHPRASEILTVLEGTLYAGFVTTNPDHRLFAKIMKPGDVIVFPFGLFHFQLNIGKTHAVAIAALTSQSPGVNTVANSIFGTSPPISPDVLTKAFHLDKEVVLTLQQESWADPSVIV